jgi:hypothetical protein
MKRRLALFVIAFLALAVLLAPGCNSKIPPVSGPPSVHVISPLNGDTMSAGIFNFTAVAEDTIAMQRVDFWCGSEMLGFSEWPAGDTYSIAVDGRTGFSGSLVLTADAVDSANYQFFDSVRVFFKP